MKKLTALFLASAALLSGCQLAQTIEPQTKDGKGMDGVSCTHVPVFNGAAAQDVGCVIDAAKLKAGASYNFGGDLLVVRGDVPKGVHINAGRAKVFIDGNLADGVHIKASKPENYRTDIMPMPVPMHCGQGCMMMILMPVSITTATGFKYPSDTDAAMVVSGHIGADVRLAGNSTYMIANGDSGVYSGMFALPAVRQVMALH